MTSTPGRLPATDGMPMRADRRLLVGLAIAFLIDACAVLLVGWADHVWVWSIAGLLHVTAGLVVLAPNPGEPTRRLLAAAMTFTLPLLGAAMAAVAVTVRGRGGDELLTRRGPVERPDSGGAVASRITGGVPACESLMADAETRRTTLAALQRAPDAHAIAILRWAMTQADPDLVIEAALAVEELSARSARRAAEACAEADRQPSRERALVAADELVRPIHNGLAEPALVRALAAQARAYYDTAASLDEARAGELAWARARLELAVLRPDAALALLEPALAVHPDDDRLLALYRDAAHAARRFELLSPEVVRERA
jgi:hypothetical protein